MTQDQNAVELRYIAEDFAVAGQISKDQVATIAHAGFKTVICNRPDGEAPDQTPYGEIESAVRDAGMEFAYIPVSPGAMSYDNVDDTRKALSGMPGPIFAYCRSGARSTQLYTVAKGQA